MKTDKDLSTIKELQYLQGTVEGINGLTNTLDIYFTGTIGLIENIPIAYTCQSPLSDSFRYRAFLINDLVIAEWDELIDIPSVNSLRIIGFSDGYPRCCKYNIVAITYENYVAFFNLDLNICHVPDTWDPVKIAQTWSDSEWIYFLTQPGEALAFIQEVLQSSISLFNALSVETLDISCPGGDCETIEYSGMYDLRQTGIAGRTEIGAQVPDTCYTKTCTSLNLTYCTGGSQWEHDIYVKEHIPSGYVLEYPEENNITYIPLEWTCNPRGSKYILEEVHDLYAPLYFWCDYAAGSNYTTKCASDWEQSWPPTSFDHLCSPSPHASQHSYHGLSREWFRQDKYCLNHSWQIHQLLYLGTGEHYIAAPPWSWLPPANPHQQLARPEITRVSEARVVVHTKGTIGYTIGEYKNVDWNWGAESGYKYDAIYPAGLDEYRIRISETVAPAVAPSWDGTEWHWTLPQKRNTDLFMKGLGLQINRTLYYNIVTENIKEHIKDRVDRQIIGEWKTFVPYECATECIGSPVGYCIPSSPEIEDSGICSRSIHKDLSGGYELKFEGVLSANALIVFELWCEHLDSSDSNFTPTMTMLSAFKYPEEDEFSNWAENRILYNDSEWLLSFFLKMSAESPDDDIRLFIKHCMYTAYETST